MRSYIVGIALLAVTVAAQGQDLTQAQRDVVPVVHKYFECGVLWSTIYAAQLRSETAETIVIASSEKCKAEYATAKAAIQDNFPSGDWPGLIATTDDQFMRSVTANVVETRLTVK